MSTTHTSGPWTYYRDTHGEYWVKANDKTIVFLKDKANARLIAAAPDLLEALKKLKSVCEDDDVYASFTEIADEAIKLATHE